MHAVTPWVLEKQKPGLEQDHPMVTSRAADRKQSGEDQAPIGKATSQAVFLGPESGREGKGLDCVELRGGEGTPRQ